MKRVLSIVLSVLLTAILLTSCGCSDSGKTEETTAADKTDAELAAYISDKLEEIKYDGVIYLTHNGNVVYQRATGTDENGEPLTVDTSMYIGSVSKQFCAAAVMILRENIFDPLDMKHTGLITEESDSPEWAENLICDSEIEAAEKPRRKTQP